MTEMSLIHTNYPTITSYEISYEYEISYQVIVKQKIIWMNPQLRRSEQIRGHVLFLQ